MEMKNVLTQKSDESLKLSIQHIPGLITHYIENRLVVFWYFEGRIDKWWCWISIDQIERLEGANGLFVKQITCI